MKITLTVDKWDWDDNPTEHDLRYILMDALYEFSAHRQPARAYCEKRYIDMPERWREEKIKTTNKRIRAAEKLHSAVFHMDYEK